MIEHAEEENERIDMVQQREKEKQVKNTHHGTTQERTTGLIE
jgi:hypothetical protein